MCVVFAVKSLHRGDLFEVTVVFRALSAALADGRFCCLYFVFFLKSGGAGLCEFPLC